LNNVLIFYGSKEEFNKKIPSQYRNLTDLVMELDRDGKKYVIEIPGTESNKTENEKIIVENFVVGSDEYAGVKEHVILNFANFLAKMEVTNLFLHNPPLQISEQIKRIYNKTNIESQNYRTITQEDIRNINDNYDQHIIGQDTVKLQLLKALYPLTLPRRQKPVVMLFYGGSGIGKTETANFISKIIGERLFRKQFSMYQNNQFANYLFGGAHYEKSFAKDLLDRESNVILLDEFDKAYTVFHSAFYQLFDEGVYEDQNYNIELKHSIIICTSNYQSENEIRQKLGDAIVNRFDVIIHFENLTSEAKIT
jgi:ATP-dependent Clp protease ATP-binding subunit ClpA